MYGTAASSITRLSMWLLWLLLLCGRSGPSSIACTSSGTLMRHVCAW
jgi:hypothetical protein